MVVVSGVQRGGNLWLAARLSVGKRASGGRENVQVMQNAGKYYENTGLYFTCEEYWKTRERLKREKICDRWKTRETEGNRVRVKLIDRIFSAFAFVAYDKVNTVFFVSKLLKAILNKKETFLFVGTKPGTKQFNA